MSKHLYIKMGDKGRLWNYVENYGDLLENLMVD